MLRIDLGVSVSFYVFFVLNTSFRNDVILALHLNILTKKPCETRLKLVWSQHDHNT